MAKVKRDTSLNRVQFDTFTTEVGLKLQNVKTAETFAFGEFWRHLSHLSKFNTCQWHSACTNFGGSNIFDTLSQVLTYNSITFIYRPRGRVNIGFFWRNPWEARIVFVLLRNYFLNMNEYEN